MSNVNKNWMVVKKTSSTTYGATDESGWCTEADARAVFRMLCEAKPYNHYSLMRFFAVETHYPPARPAPGSEQVKPTGAFAFAKR